ncbi:PLP-dependent aminotransferase family protein [Roseomonas eburnea]|uniref:PLP-dependent aminotransferase family protein n=1 Tax=Neoroseomonas eburnea TaxID=1346889 RepID=A0A9X9X7I1_9PROT|nr:PLP-dependent aminotransferase family protein [Neoroseomonas eburnea]MBR0679667.1 PLP-dependent aminotransferase family protein [Neoroseomonas eburnea]
MTRTMNAPPWTRRIDDQEGPIYLAIAEAIGAAIAAGEIRGGERLPTHRALAEALGVDLTTVTRAYAEARRRGLLQATVGRGTFVRQETAVPSPRAGAQDGPVDLGMNLPPLPAELALPDLLQRGLARLLAGPDTADLLTYRTGAGATAERAAGATWLRPTLGEVAAERVLVSPGAQPALLAVLGAVAGAGETVLTDALTYPGIRGAAAQLGVRLLGVAGDAEGLLPEAVEAACRMGSRSKALYCVPTMHNPTAVTMTLARRRAIAEVARRHGLRVIEDDAYGLLPASPLPAIASLAPEICFHVATVSKVLSPALRVAYLAVPDARSAAQIAAVLRANVLMASPLLTGLMAAWVRDGTAGTILAAIRRECVARQRIARDILEAGSFDAHPEGLHLWLRLPERWDRLHFAAHLRRQGLAVVPSDAFAVDPSAPPVGAVRLSLGAAPSREALRGALRSVAEALRSEAALPFAEVV